jgi:hypothetical protein
MVEERLTMILSAGNGLLREPLLAAVTEESLAARLGAALDRLELQAE